MSAARSIARYAAPLSGRLAVVSCAAVLLAAGCQRIEREVDAVTRDTEGVQTDRSGDMFRFATESAKTGHATPQATAEGSSAAALPTDFPADIYRPAQYRVLDADGSAVGDRRAGLRTLRLRSPGPASQRYVEARRGMLDHGWRQVKSLQRGAGYRQLAFTKDQRTAVLTFQDEARGEARITLQWRSAP